MSAMTIDLDEEHAGMVRALASQEGLAVGKVVEMALEMLAVAVLGRAGERPLSDQEIAEMKQALAEIERGEGIPHEQVVAETRAEFER